MKKLKLITTLSSIGLTAAITPIVATSCSCSNNGNSNIVNPDQPNNKPTKPDYFYPEYDLDTEMGVDSIPGPVQPDFDIDTEMQVPSFGPVQPEEDIDTDMGVDSIPGPVQPDGDIDTDINVDVNNSAIVEITYNELVALKKANNLVEGQSYRITDYVATTSQTEWSIAANNKFDIIVTALTNNILSEDAKAIQSNADNGYFANNNLAAWSIKYCLENNTSRFNWATSNGKGVIYYMKDEFGNEAPYDFKNFKFKPYFDSKNSKTKYNSNFFCYTFASSYSADNSDLSISSESKVYWNSLGNNETYTLPRIVLFGTETFNNKFENGCSDITFGSSLATKEDGTTYFRGNNFGNTFAQYCEKMTFEGSCYSNSFGQKNINNVFGLTCFYNTFGAYNWGSIFGNNFVANSFGNHNYRNKFGDNNWSNSFGNDCRDNTFGNDCNYNDFGNNCYNNKLGNNCLGNLFAINCVGVTLKDNTSNQKINI